MSNYNNDTDAGKYKKVNNVMFFCSTLIWTETIFIL